MLEIPLLERLLDGRVLPLEVREGSTLNAAGNFQPGTPTPANPFAGKLIPGAIAIGINVIDNQLDTPYVQQFNFGVQHEVLRDLVVSVDAIHSFGSSFIIGRAIGSVFNPVIGGNEGIVNIESSVKTWYDAMLVNVQKRFSNRFTFNAGYTLAKSFNFSNDDQIPFQGGPINPKQLRLEKGPAPNDQRHRFTFAGVFDGPWGVQISPIYTLASDVPIDILTARPDGSITRVPILQRNAGGRLFRTGAEFNAFANNFNATAPAADRLPLVDDNLKFGDSFTSFDLRLTKTIKLSERVNVQGIVEAFNLFNVTNIRGVNNVNFSGFQNVLGPGFGDPIQTAGGVFGTGGPRAFQFAARFNF